MSGATGDLAQLHRVVALGLEQFGDDVEDPVTARRRCVSVGRLLR